MSVQAGDSFYSVATAYGPPWGGIEGTGKTSTGIQLGGVGSSPRMGGFYLAAVDPSVIPYGTTFVIDPSPYPNAIWMAADTGGAFHIGKGRIDLFMPEGRAAQNGWGKKRVHVGILAVGTGPKDYRIQGAIKNPPEGGRSPIANAGNALSGAAGAVGDAAGSVADTVGSIPAFLAKLAVIFQGGFWLRIGKIVLGIAALIGGAVFIGKEFAGGQVASLAGKAGKAVMGEV